MLVFCVIIYMLATIAIGLYASLRVKDSKDFMVAGRSLPLYMNFACVFATWFGAETVLSVSAKFANQGMGFVSGDPFGASVCLLLVAFFFAKTFYRLELLTIGDYYHVRYGKTVEIITSLAIAASYMGWTSAQLSALGLVTNVMFPSLTLNESIMIGAVIVTIYTMFGGMWSVALTDVVQTAAIVIGLIIVAALMGQEAGGVGVVLQKAKEAGKLNLFPHVTAAAWLAFIGEFITMSLGSIPQQDVFQRVTSAKDEKTALIGTAGGGLFYFFFAFVPMFIAFSATIIDAEAASHFASEDVREYQKVLPQLVLNKTPIWCQVLFFGAVMSAILSTASGTLLAPSSILTENVLQPLIKHFNDKQMLLTIRSILVLVAITGTYLSVNSKSSMYEMVESGYSVTLVLAFVPLACGVYWKRATTQGAIFSILLALPVWLGCEYLPEEASQVLEQKAAPTAQIDPELKDSADEPVRVGTMWQHVVEKDTVQWYRCETLSEKGEAKWAKISEEEASEPLWRSVPAQLYGLLASFIGMILGSLMPNWIRHTEKSPGELKNRSGAAMGH